MSGAAVDAAFVISLEEQSYREEEEMRKEAEAERLKHETDEILVAGDAKKGAGLFKVRPGYTPIPHVHASDTWIDSLRTVSYHSGRTK